MARRKKNRKGQHIDESWLIPYADILTLLLALFIVLFALSSIDAQKFQQLARALNANFDGGVSVLEYPSPLPEKSMENLEKNEEKKEEENETEQNGQQAREERGLSDVQNSINQYIANNQLKGKIQTSRTDEGLLITIRDDILFDSGSAQIRKKDEILVTDIAKMLGTSLPHNIVISGHTDNVPIHNSDFDSNWHLSVMRAVNVMKVILDKNKQLDPSKFSAKGYGEYKPIASNATAAGRQKNRRVEILILPNQSKEPK